jgi:hypothetical protein
MTRRGHALVEGNGIVGDSPAFVETLTLVCTDRSGLFDRPTRGAADRAWPQPAGDGGSTPREERTAARRSSDRVRASESPVGRQHGTRFLESHAMLLGVCCCLPGVPFEQVCHRVTGPPPAEVSAQRLGDQLRREAPAAASPCWAATDHSSRVLKNACSRDGHPLQRRSECNSAVARSRRGDVRDPNSSCSVELERSFASADVVFTRRFMQPRLSNCGCGSGCTPPRRR